MSSAVSERMSPAGNPPQFDNAVIGGGINGCGIARDAAGRGARVVLIEAGDLASGTSSASTKLIHGGLRYLEHYEFRLVRESLAEREILWGIAPHIIHPLRFVLPQVPGLRPAWLVRTGLWLYDHIGGRKRLPPTQSVDLRRHPAGAPLKPEFAHAFVYSDCWVDDARLVVLNARSAADMGADIRTHAPVTGLAREGQLWRITADGETLTAGAVANAAGPSVVHLLETGHIPSPRRIRLVRGSHIVVRKLFDHPNPYFFQLPDGRIFFAIPYESDFTLIGTTDQDHHGSLDHVTASAAEIAYLCEGASRFFKQPISPDMVVWSYAGVRPLVDDGSGRPEAATRGYTLDLSAPDEGAPLLSVFGGKITTYRHLAQEAVDALGSRVAALTGGRWTREAPLPGGDFAIDARGDLTADLARRYAFLEPAWRDRLVSAYGTLLPAVLGDAATLAECGQHFSHGLTEREVTYLIRHEWARTAEDILWRRTKLGLRFSAEESAELAAAVDRIGATTPR